MQRTKTQAGKTERQIVVPMWVVDEIVWAMPAATGVSVDGTAVGLGLIRTGAWASIDPLPATQVGI